MRRKKTPNTSQKDILGWNYRRAQAMNSIAVVPKFDFGIMYCAVNKDAIGFL